MAAFVLRTAAIACKKKEMSSTKWKCPSFTCDYSWNNIHPLSVWKVRQGQCLSMSSSVCQVKATSGQLISNERCSKFSCGFYTLIKTLRQSLRFAYVSQVLAYDRFVSMIWAYGDLTAKEGCKLHALDFFEIAYKSILWLCGFVVVTVPFRKVCFWGRLDI